MELAVIAVIALIVLGPARLPEMARSLGKGMRELRGAFSGEGGDSSSSRKLDEADEDEDDLAHEDDDEEAHEDALADDDPAPIDLDADDEGDDDDDVEFRSSSSDVETPAGDAQRADAKPAASA